MNNNDVIRLTLNLMPVKVAEDVIYNDTVIKTLARDMGGLVEIITLVYEKGELKNTWTSEIDEATIFKSKKDGSYRVGFEMDKDDLGEEGQDIIEEIKETPHENIQPKIEPDRNPEPKPEEQKVDIVEEVEEVPTLDAMEELLDRSKDTIADNIDDTTKRKMMEMIKSDDDSDDTEPIKPDKFPPPIQTFDDNNDDIIMTPYGEI